MIIPCSVDVMVLTKKENESKTEKGKFYYKIGVMIEDELGELSASEEAYKGIEKGQKYRLSCTFNTQYDRFMIKSAIPLK